MRSPQTLSEATLELRYAFKSTPSLEGYGGCGPHGDTRLASHPFLYAGAAFGILGVRRVLTNLLFSCTKGAP